MFYFSMMNLFRQLSSYSNKLLLIKHNYNKIEFIIIFLNCLFTLLTNNIKNNFLFVISLFFIYLYTIFKKNHIDWIKGVFSMISLVKLIIHTLISNKTCIHLIIIISTTYIIKSDPYLAINSKKKFVKMLISFFF
jgi:hypothetical protein